MADYMYNSRYHDDNPYGSRGSRTTRRSVYPDFDGQRVSQRRATSLDPDRGRRVTSYQHYSRRQDNNHVPSTHRRRHRSHSPRGRRSSQGYNAQGRHRQLPQSSRHDSRRDRPRDRGHPRQTHAVRDTRPDNKLGHSAKAAVDAAVIEAIRLRNRPGDWYGQKGARVATAALGAAVTDTAADKFRDESSDKHSGRHLIESTAGGLLVNRMLNGPRDPVRRRR